jgi:hypothetical protein
MSLKWMTMTALLIFWILKSIFLIKIDWQNYNIKNLVKLL